VIRNQFAACRADTIYSTLVLVSRPPRLRRRATQPCFCDGAQSVRPIEPPPIRKWYEPSKHPLSFSFTSNPLSQKRPAVF